MLGDGHPLFRHRAAQRVGLLGRGKLQIFQTGSPGIGDLFLPALRLAKLVNKMSLAAPHCGPQTLSGQRNRRTGS